MKSKNSWAPICMKTGNPIDCDLENLKYQPMPNSLDECEMFFENLSNRIRSRTEKIYKKLKLK